MILAAMRRASSHVSSRAAVAGCEARPERACPVSSVKLGLPLNTVKNCFAARVQIGRARVYGLMRFAWTQPLCFALSVTSSNVATARALRVCFPRMASITTPSYGAFAGRAKIAELIDDWFYRTAHDFRWDMHEPAHGRPYALRALRL